MAAIPDALTDANEEQADTVDVLDANTSSDKTIAPEPPKHFFFRTGNIPKPILNQPIAS